MLATSQRLLTVAIFSTLSRQFTRTLYRTSFKRVQDRIAMLNRQKQREKICGGNKPPLVEEPEETGVQIERSTGKMAATILLPAAGTKDSHFIRTTDMSSR